MGLPQTEISLPILQLLNSCNSCNSFFIRSIRSEPASENAWQTIFEEVALLPFENQESVAKSCYS
jgi:hypothetical protein